MNRLYIEQNKGTPLIDFDPRTNILKIEGQSYPENAFKFYEPILTWINDFLEETDRAISIEINFNLPYINSSSTKCIMMMLDTFEDYHNSGKNVCVRWFYDEDNESSFECAEEFKEDLSLPFSIVKTN